VDALAADNPGFWMLLVLALAVLYILSTLIGLLRGVENLALLVVINLVGGMTCVGWPATLIGAFLMPKKSGRPPEYHPRW